MIKYRKNKKTRRQASDSRRKKNHKKIKQHASNNKLIVAVIIIAAVAVSVFNITGFVTGSGHTIAFISGSSVLQGSEKTLYNELSANNIVTIVPLTNIKDLSGYQIIIISRQAGDTFTDNMQPACKQLINKPILFLSSQFSTVCRLTIGGSTAPYMPWTVTKESSNFNYPTQPYSGIIVPYKTSESIPAIVVSGKIISLVRRSSNDAYVAVYSDSKKAFFSIPSSEFAFTPEGKDIFKRTLEWLVEDFR